MNSWNSGILILKEKKIIFSNDTMERMFKANKEDLLGKSPVDYSPKEQLQGKLSIDLAKEYISACYKGETQQFVWLHQDSEGNSFETFVTLFPAKNQHDLLVGVVNDLRESQNLKSILDDSANIEAKISELLLPLKPRSSGDGDSSKVLESIQRIDRKIWNSSENNVLAGVLEMMREEIGADILFIGRVIKGAERLCKVEQISDKEKSIMPFNYSLKGTPTENVLEIDQTIHYKNNVQTSFPEGSFLEEYEVEGYIGSPIKLINNNEDKYVLVALYKEEIRDIEFIEDVINLTSLKLSLELDKRLLYNKFSIHDKSLRAIQTKDRIGVWDYLVKEDIWHGDDVLCDLFFISKQDGEKGLPSKEFIKSIHTDDVAYVQDRMQKAFTQKMDFVNVRYRLRNIDRTKIYWVVANGIVHFDNNGDATRFQGAITDISEFEEQKTELEKSELKLREEERFKNLLLEGSSDGLIIYDDSNSAVMHNGRFLEFFPNSGREDKNRIDFREISCYSVHNKFYERGIQELLDEGKKINEIYFGYKDEEEKFRWLKYSISKFKVFNTDGSEKEYKLFSISDHTSEIERRKIDTVLSTAVESLHEGFVIQDKNSRIIQMNDRACEILGLTRKQMEGRDSFDPRWRTIDEEGNDLPGENHPVPITLRTGKENNDFIMGVHKPDGSLTWISINSAPLYSVGDEKSKPSAAVALFSDITSLLRERQELKTLHSAVSQLSNHVMISDSRGKITYVNPAFEKGTGYKLEEVKGKMASVLNSGEQDDSYYTSMWKTILSGNPFRSEIVNKTKTGELLNQELFITPVLDSLNNISSFLAIYTDLDEKEKMQIAERELREKEVLIQEIHHRVKNNLQIISSLLSLQSSQTEISEVTEMFDDAQSRINTISLVHEKLYKNSNYQFLSLKDYFTNLLGNLASTSGSTIQIKQKIEIEDIEVNLDRIIPLGLIVNEITTNTYKYSFTKDSVDPTLSLKIKKEEGINVLELSDNGKGIEDFKGISSYPSLGMRLIDSLSRQLNGKIEVETAKNQGIRYTLKFE